MFNKVWFLVLLGLSLLIARTIDQYMSMLTITHTAPLTMIQYTVSECEKRNYQYVTHESCSYIWLWRKRISTRDSFSLWKDVIIQYYIFTSQCPSQCPDQILLRFCLAWREAVALTAWWLLLPQVLWLEWPVLL